MSGRNWGSDVIPKDKWIDPNKKYFCSAGRVTNLEIKLHNSNGDEVTFPVKGSIIVRTYKTKPPKLEYCAWTLDGRYCVGIGNENSKMNLREV